MSKKFSRAPLAFALGAAFTLAGNAQASVFQTTDLTAGYMVASAGEAKKGDADKDASKEVNDKAGCEKMKAEGKCGEGKCGDGACGPKAAGKAKSETEQKPKEGK